MIGTRKRLIGLVGAISVITGQFAIAPIASAESMGSADKGKEIAFDRKKGNCLACHTIAGGEAPGNIAPALVAMQSRFADKQALYNQIWDATVKNPESAMPPFGKHGVLSEQQLKDVVEFVWTL